MRRSLLTFFLIGLFVIISAMLYYNLSSPLAMGPEEAKVALKEGKFDAVVDVRTDPEWNLGHYPLAIHIPLKQVTAELPKRIPEKAAKILFYCNTSSRSRAASEEAVKLGYKNVRYLLGTHKNIM